MHATTNNAATAALHQAAARGDERAVLRALGAGADVNAPDARGRSVLWLALLGDSDIEKAADAGNTGPEDAARVAVLSALLRAPGISLMTLNAANVVTPLALASWLNRPKSVLALLRDSDGAAAVDCMDAGGATPLMYAARDGSVDVARILLGHGARADLCDASDRSVCHHALGSPQILWMCELALRRQRFRSYARKLKLIASTSSASGPGTATPTSAAAQLQALIAASLPPDALSHTPPSASRLNARALETANRSVVDAVKLGNADVLHTLLFPPHGSLASPILLNLPDAFGLTPFQHAVSVDEPKPEVIDALYRAGADTTLPTSDSTGRSALHLFARHAHDAPGMYQLAIHLVHELRCSLAAQDAKGETPLHVAAEYGLSGEVLLALLDCDVDGAVRDMPNSRGLSPREVAQPQFAALFAPEGRSESALTVRERPASYNFGYAYPAVASTLSLSTASSLPRRPSAPDPALAMTRDEAARAARFVAAILGAPVDGAPEELGDASRLALALVGSWSARLDRAIDEAAVLRASRARAASLLGKARDAHKERAAELDGARKAEKDAAKVKKKTSFFAGMRRGAQNKAVVSTKSAPDLRTQGQQQSLVGVIRGMMRGRGMTLASSPSKGSMTATTIPEEPRSPTGSMYRSPMSPASPGSPWMSPMSPSSPTGSFIAPWNVEPNHNALLTPDESVVRGAPKLFARIDADVKTLDAALSELDQLISRAHHSIRSADASIDHAIAQREEEALDAWFTAALDRSEHDFEKPLPPPPTPPKSQSPILYQQSNHGRNSSISSSARSRSRSFSRSVTVASTAPTSLPGSPVAAQGAFPHRRHAKLPSLDGLVTVACDGLPALLAATAAQLDAVEREVERLTTWTRVARETVKAARRALAA